MSLLAENGQAVEAIRAIGEVIILCKQSNPVMIQWLNRRTTLVRSSPLLSHESYIVLRIAL